MNFLLRKTLLISSTAFCILWKTIAQDIPKEFINPPREFSVIPFWFWNDSLKDEEIIRQIDDFEKHGVYGFVIHPRIGLPDNIKWLSPEMIHFMSVAISEAAKRNMYVVLYDEGMYPSGSSGGQVVARNPDHAARGLAKIDLKKGETLSLPAGNKLITTITRPDGSQVAIVDQPSGGVIRGLHYIGEGDLVWRYVEPGSSALSGQHSTMAKCASSAMLHNGLRRNSNELYGAYGHNLTYDEVEWLANWCFVRGQNLLIPHAFYYSIRGPRFDERPPDVGPNSDWWKKYKSYADVCSRLSWLNTDSKQVCTVAILGEASWLPDKSAKICFQHQRDFNYLEINNLWGKAKIDSKGVYIEGMNYGAVILDSLSAVPVRAKKALKKLALKGRLIVKGNSGLEDVFKKAVVYNSPQELINAIDKLVTPDLILSPGSENIRYSHVIKGSDHFYILFNEEEAEVNTRIHVSASGTRHWLDPKTAEALYSQEDEIVNFKPHELKILRVNNLFKLPPI